FTLPRAPISTLFPYTTLFRSFFESYDELNYVVAKLTPTLKKKTEARGFILMNWGHGGWTQLFTKKPVQTVADVKGVKLRTSAGRSEEHTSELPTSRMPSSA